MKQNANALPLIRHARRAESEDDEASMQPLNWRDFQSKHSSQHSLKKRAARKTAPEMNTMFDHMAEMSQSDHDDDSSVQTFELSAQQAVDAEDYIVRRRHSNLSNPSNRKKPARMKHESMSVSHRHNKKSPASVPVRIQVQKQPSKNDLKPAATGYREKFVSRSDARSNSGVENIDHEDDMSSITAGTTNTEDFDRRLSMQRNFLGDHAHQFTKEDLEAIEYAIAEECSIEQQRREKIQKSEDTIQHSIAMAHLWIDNDPNERRRNFGKNLSPFELEALGSALTEATRRRERRNSENHTI